MSVRPSEWLSVKIEDVVEILDALRVPVNNTERLERIEGKNMEDLYPYYGATGEVGKIDDYIFDEELVALGEDGVPFLDHLKNKAYLLVGKTWVNNHAHVLKGWNKCFNNRFLLHYLNQFDYHGYVNGGTRLKLTQASMRKIPTPLTSIVEQKEIADRLDTLLAQVETIQSRLARIPYIIKQFRQSVLAEAVRGKLTEEWRDIHKPEPQIFDAINDAKNKLIKSKNIKKDLEAKIALPTFDIPNEWLYLKLQSIASKITDGEHKTPQRETSGRYLLSARNIQDGYISVTNVDYVGEDEFQKLRKRCDPNKGDILISCSGSVGRVCLVDDDDKYVMVRSAAFVRIMDDFVNGRFLMYFLQSPISQKEIENSSKATAQSNLFLGPIKELGVVLPSLEEQTEIVRRVEQLFAYADTIELQAKAAKARVDKLTQAILAKAFRGELTADWRAANPELISGDNSAAALLARIQAERAAAKPRKSRRV